MAKPCGYTQRQLTFWLDAQERKADKRLLVDLIPQTPGDLLHHLYTHYTQTLKRPITRPSRKYPFTRSVYRLVAVCSGKTPLTFRQVNQVFDLFDFIESYLPKHISHPFVMYKLLDCILLKGEQRLMLARLEEEIPKSTRHNHEKTWTTMLTTMKRLTQEHGAATN